MKKLFGILLAMCIAIGINAPCVIAYEECLTDDNVFYLYRNGTRSDALTLDYDSSGINYSLKGTVTIPSEIQNYKVTGIDNKGFWQCENLENIVIPDTVEIVREQAFYNCPNLRSVTIPDSVKVIENAAFAYCPSLQSVTIPEGVETIGEQAFYNCTNLQSVTIPKSVKTIGSGAFTGCDNLADVYYGGTKEDIKALQLGEITHGLIYNTIHFSETNETQVSSNEQSDNGVTVTIDGSQLSFDVPPQIINDRTMVPLRAIFEALGASVDWNQDTQTVTSEKDGTTISLTINSPTMYVNGTAVTLDSPACVVDDRTLVPVRAISEAYNTSVDWDNNTRTVKITSNGSETTLEATVAPTAAPISAPAPKSALPGSGILLDYEYGPFTIDSDDSITGKHYQKAEISSFVFTSCELTPHKDYKLSASIQGYSDSDSAWIIVYLYDSNNRVIDKIEFLPKMAKNTEFNTLDTTYVDKESIENCKSIGFFSYDEVAANTPCRAEDTDDSDTSDTSDTDASSDGKYSYSEALNLNKKASSAVDYANKAMGYANKGMLPSGRYNLYYAIGCAKQAVSYLDDVIDILEEHQDIKSDSGESCTDKAKEARKLLKKVADIDTSEDLDDYVDDIVDNCTQGAGKALSIEFMSVALVDAFSK